MIQTLMLPFLNNSSNLLKVTGVISGVPIPDTDPDADTKYLPGTGLSDTDTDTDTRYLLGTDLSDTDTDTDTRY